jgi:hypothetical protein
MIAGMPTRPSAAEFVSAFTASYSDRRHEYKRDLWCQLWVEHINDFWNWFMMWKMVVALEHENLDLNFRHEIRKLMSVRCPLKVGITYTWCNPAVLPCAWHEGRRADIQQHVCVAYSRIASVIAEDSRTEYVFLVGSEEQEKEWTRYALTFPAGTGPSGGFVAVS